MLWVAAQLLGLVLTRLQLGAGNLAALGRGGDRHELPRGRGHGRGDRGGDGRCAVGLAAALLYALAYTLELLVSLALYFGSPGADEASCSP